MPTTTTKTKVVRTRRTETNQRKAQKQRKRSNNPNRQKEWREKNLEREQEKQRARTEFRRLLLMPLPVAISEKSTKHMYVDDMSVATFAQVIDLSGDVGRVRSISEQLAYKHPKRPQGTKPYKVVGEFVYFDGPCHLTKDQLEGIASNMKTLVTK